MKKCTALILAILISAGHPFPAAAAEMPLISAKSAAVMEAATGRMIYSQNGEERLPMASTTKIMTALLTLEQPEQDEPFVVDSDAIRVEGSSMGLTEGAEVTLHTLAAGMLLASGNDGANAAAVKISGSIPDFAILMNQRAAALDMKNTNFETPSGLDSQNHYTTAEDMARLAGAALQNENFLALCSQPAMKLCYGNPPGNRWLRNHNRLLTEYEGCIGMKTGFTKKSGRCLVSAAERDGIRLVCVTLNAPDDWNDHKKLLDAGFSELALIGQKPEQILIPVTGGTEESLIAGAGEFPEPAARISELPRIRIEVEAPPFVYAPVTRGQKLGKIRWILDGEEIYTVPLTAQQNVEILKQEKPAGPLTGFFRWIAARLEI